MQSSHFKNEALKKTNNPKTMNNKKITTVIKNIKEKNNDDVSSMDSVTLSKTSTIQRNILRKEQRHFSVKDLDLTTQEAIIVSLHKILQIKKN